MANLGFPKNPTVGLTHVASNKRLYYWTGSTWKDLGSLASVDESGDSKIPVASEDSVGGVKIGDGVEVDSEGTISFRQVNPDWDERNPESPSFIKNRPLDTAKISDITYEAINANGDVGSGSNQLAPGDHDHEIGDMVLLFENQLI